MNFLKVTTRNEPNIPQLFVPQCDICKQVHTVKQVDPSQFELYHVRCPFTCVLFGIFTITSVYLGFM